MRAKITKASDYFDVKFAEFNTLEDLLKFQEECGEELIIARPWKRKNGERVYDVIIYDDYVEPREEPIRCKDCEHYEITDDMNRLKLVEKKLDQLGEKIQQLEKDIYRLEMSYFTIESKQKYPQITSTGFSVYAGPEFFNGVSGT